MSEKWKNLFWFERHGKEEEEKKEQLENNTTKSFLKVLMEDCSRRLTKALFEKLGIEVPTSYSKEDFHYKYQVNTNEIAGDAQIHLIGISTEEPPENLNSSDSGGILDGVIRIEGKNNEKIVLAIEVKTSDDRISGNQMGKYIKALGLTTEEVKFLKWQEEIYDLLKEELEKNYLNDKGKFLVKEFKKYLGLMGMAPFQGFSEGARDFIKNYNKKAQEEFWDGKEKLLKEIEGKIKKEDWWDSEWETSNKLNYHHKRAGLVKFYKGPKWGEKKDGDQKGIHYELLFSQELASDRKMILSLHIENKAPKGFAERLMKKLEEKKIVQKIEGQKIEGQKIEGYKINGKPGFKVGFLHRDVEIELENGKETVNAATKAIREIAHETPLTECIDECLEELKV